MSIQYHGETFLLVQYLEYNKRLISYLENFYFDLIS